jgi:hypothetical protein
MGKLSREQRKALRLERLRKKAEEAGVPVEQFKKQKRAARMERLAKEAEKTGLSVGALKKKLREERRQQFLLEEQEKRRKIEERRKQGPIAPPGVIAKAGVHFERSKDPIGDFCKRHKDEPVNRVMSLATGCFGWLSKRWLDILRKLLETRKGEMGEWNQPWLMKRLGEKTKKVEDEEEETEVVIVKEVVPEVAHSKPKKVKGKIARK